MALDGSTYNWIMEWPSGLHVMLEHVLKDMNTVITGESGGIGLAVAQELQEAGAGVEIAGRNQEKLARAAITRQSQDSRARAFCVDVTDCMQFQEASLRIEQESCSVDILVNNRGITDPCLTTEVNGSGLASVNAREAGEGLHCDTIRPRHDRAVRGDKIIPITSPTVHRGCLLVGLCQRCDLLVINMESGLSI